MKVATESKQRTRYEFNDSYLIYLDDFESFAICHFPLIRRFDGFDGLWSHLAEPSQVLVSFWCCLLGVRWEERKGMIHMMCNEHQ